MRKSTIILAVTLLSATPTYAADDCVLGASPLLDAKAVAQFSPRARIDLIDIIAADIDGTMLSTPLRIQHFMTQIATETGGLVSLTENLNYSSERMLKVFRGRVTSAQTEELAHNPIAIANQVYYRVNGNRLPDDGWSFRGSGFIQLTGRGNFAARGKELGLDLESNPDLVRTPKVGFQVATAFWRARKVNEYADRDDLRAVRFAVNGGYNGMAEAKIWRSRARKAFGEGLTATNGPDDDELEGVQDRLIELGFLKNDEASGNYPGGSGRHVAWGPIGRRGLGPCAG